MKEIRELLENVWILRETDKEEFYRIKHAIPEFQKFVREQLGWRLLQTENLLKLEKIPAHAESFMGIQEFTEPRDYCLLCGVLMYLEDKEEEERFLLSELIHYLELQLKDKLPLDWTSFSLRKSLVRALQYAEKTRMLKVYEGQSEEFGRESGSEVLYENTGYSKYFATSFTQDISEWKKVQDFENNALGNVNADTGKARANRIYRQLLASPMLYWESSEDPDAVYLKHQRGWISRNLEEQIGGRLDLHRNAAFWMVEEEDPYGRLHPRDAMLPEAVTLVCSGLRRQVEEKKLVREEDDCIYLTGEQMEETIRQCQDTYRRGWSKEFREMPPEKLVRTVIGYMKEWMMIEECEDCRIRVYPIVGKIAGYYPAEFEEKMNE